jgi:hypothetical protein
MPERDVDYALAKEAECFGFVTVTGEYLICAEATARIGYTAEASLMQQNGAIAA